jgi:mono/diheme cytochrome c family protein
MKYIKRIVITIVVLLTVLLAWLLVPRQPKEVELLAGTGDVQRGEYLVHAAGCISCHISPSNPPALSGGEVLISPFGNFTVPNITPDPRTGIGGWSESQLVRAVTQGLSPEGSNYFPAFPYRAYAGMRDQDAQDIAAWLLTQPPVEATSSDHELPFPTGLGRLAMSGWNRIADLLQPELAVDNDPQIQRGAYLARNLGHCGECHTPRNQLGISDLEREFAGAPVIDGEASAINGPALADWSEDDFAFFLLLGLKPDEDYVGGEMEPVIEHNTSPLTDEDRRALAAFFKRGQ